MSAISSVATGQHGSIRFVSETGPAFRMVATAVVEGGSALSYVPPYQFNTPSLEWVINHNLNKFVQAEAFTPGGLRRIAEIETSLNQVRIRFDEPSTGFAIIKP